MVMRYVYVDGKELLTEINGEQYIYVIGFEPFTARKMKASKASMTWIVFLSAKDCTSYYGE